MAKNRTQKEILAARLIKVKMAKADEIYTLSTKVLSKSNQEIANDINWFYRNIGTKGVVEFEDAYSYLTQDQRDEYAGFLREINKSLKENFTRKQVEQIFGNYSAARTNYDALRNLVNLRSLNTSGSLIGLYDKHFGGLKDLKGYDFADIKERIMNLAGNLAGTVNQELLQAIALKAEAKAVLAGLKDGLDRTAYGYARIVRTETNRIINIQELEYYRNELGPNGWVQISAILDKHTCELCEDLDGEEVQIKNAKVGVNIPPFHPNDRCFIIMGDSNDFNYEKDDGNE